MFMEFITSKNNCISVSNAKNISSGLLKFYSIKKEVYWHVGPAKKSWIKFNAMELTELGEIKFVQNTTATAKRMIIETSLNNFVWETVYVIDEEYMNEGNYEISFNNIPFIFLRITYFDHGDIHLRNLEISGYEEYKTEKFISVLYSSFYESKVRELFPFFPNMLKTYLKMLETNYNVEHCLVPKNFEVKIESEDVTGVSGALNTEPIDIRSISSLD